MKKYLVGKVIPDKDDIEMILEQYIDLGAEIVRFAFDSTNNSEIYEAEVPEYFGDTTEFKYILDVYGNTESWTRLPFYMLSGSVPLKIDSPYA